MYSRWKDEAAFELHAGLPHPSVSSRGSSR